MTTTLNQIKPFLDILCVGSYTFYFDSAQRFFRSFCGFDVNNMFLTACFVVDKHFEGVGRLKMMEK